MRITFPVNYNPSLMEMINKNKLPNGFKISYMKRVNKKRNLWVESNLEDIRSLVPDEGLIILDLE